MCGTIFDFELLDAVCRNKLALSQCCALFVITLRVLYYECNMCFKATTRNQTTTNLTYFTFSRLG